jgi:choline dehydrogenase
LQNDFLGNTERLLSAKYAKGTPSMFDSDDWDTIIVGAGSAGCPLADRLSADEGRRVLLLEAGPSDRHIMLKLPSGNFQLIGDQRFDWRFSTEPEPELYNRRLLWPRGKVVGGCSAINGLVAVRGHPDDYNGWHNAGCDGWSWRDVLPYFLKLEDFEPGASEFHNVGGPLPLSNARSKHFLCDAVVEAARAQLGLAATHDFNGPSQDGAGYYHVTVTRSLIPLRVSVAGAYLRKARRHPNLKILPNALAHRIVFEGRRACGIVYSVGDRLHQAKARRQVILAAGTVASPHLLELSGIGDPEHLRALGIDVVCPIPAVGKNLQDHLQTVTVYRVNVETVNDKVRTVFHKLLTAFEGVFLRTGAYYGVTHFGMFMRTNPKLTRPDVQFFVHPASGSFRQPHPFSGLSIAACQLRPESRGSISTTSTDPHQPPAIRGNYLSAELDRRVMVATLRISRRLALDPALSRYIIEEHQPGLNVQTDDEFLDFTRRTAETIYHPVGTCRMGADGQSVVDPRLRVRGVEGLYVADASIMPTLVSCNTHLPTVMIGEKASDIVREDEQSKRTLTSLALGPTDCAPGLSRRINA